MPIVFKSVIFSFRNQTNKILVIIKLNWAMGTATIASPFFTARSKNSTIPATKMPEIPE